jgi:hypothetical protein
VAAFATRLDWAASVAGGADREELCGVGRATDANFSVGVYQIMLGFAAKHRKLLHPDGSKRGLAGEPGWEPTCSGLRRRRAPPSDYRCRSHPLRAAGIGSGAARPPFPQVRLIALVASSGLMFGAADTAIRNHQAPLMCLWELPESHHRRWTGGRTVVGSWCSSPAPHRHCVVLDERVGCILCTRGCELSEGVPEAR